MADDRAQHLREMRTSIEDYTLQKVDIARERDQARDEAAQMTMEKDVLQMDYGAAA